MAHSPRSPSFIPLAERRAMEREMAGDGYLTFAFENYRVILKMVDGVWMVDRVVEKIGPMLIEINYTEDEFADAVEDGQDIMNNAMEWASE